MGFLCVCLGQCEGNVGSGEEEEGICKSLVLAMDRNGGT